MPSMLQNNTVATLFPEATPGFVTVASGTEVPGVTRVRMKIPGVTVTLSHYMAREGCEIRRLLSDHLLTYLLSPMRVMNRYVMPGMNAGESFETGYMSLLPANTPYRVLMHHGDIKSINLLIDPQHFDNVTGIGRAWACPTSLDIHDAFVEGQLWRLAQEMAAPGFAAETMVEGLSLSIMSGLARALKGRQEQPERRAGCLSPAQMRLITDYIHNAREHSPTITDIAALIGVSPRHLTKAFKQTVGQTVHDYVAETRISKAATLLSSTDLPMKEVSARLGFSQLANFSKAFRTATGQTPTVFRKLFQKRGSSALN